VRIFGSRRISGIGSVVAGTELTATVVDAITAALEFAFGVLPAVPPASVTSARKSLLSPAWGSVLTAATFELRFVLRNARRLGGRLAWTSGIGSASTPRWPMS